MYTVSLYTEGWELRGKCRQERLGCWIFTGLIRIIFTRVLIEECHGKSDVFHCEEHPRRDGEITQRMSKCACSASVRT